VLKAFDGRETDYDLLVTIPMHGGAEAITRSQMGDGGGWLPTHKHTLQSRDFANVFALGDATDLPSSKAGAVAHFQSEVLFDNVLRYVGGKPARPGLRRTRQLLHRDRVRQGDAHRLQLHTEPLPGRFPLPGVGPFTLLEESATNHWGKLAFKWLYWNVLLDGKELPLDHRMLMAGKWS
jgi:sulfide:quinone oxidoreductase